MRHILHTYGVVILLRHQLSRIPFPDFAPELTMIDLKRYVADVPDFDRFLTVDEINAAFAQIAADHPDISSIKRVGSSTLGDPIPMLTIGSGSKNALLFGCPHPNEPIGALMLHYLAGLLIRDADLRDGMDYTWNLIASVDPDGTRLNEAWFAGPFTPTNYARHFYRPASKDQVEWTFPISYKKLYWDKTMPETEALMRAIDDLKPAVMASLHNAGFSGLYYYLSDAAPDLYQTLHDLGAWEGLPLDLGEGEVPWLEPFAPAIFPMIDTRQIYDHTEAHGGDPVAGHAGASSNDYARPYNTFSIVTEVAYFDDPRVMDQSQSDRNRREAVLEGIDLGENSRIEMAEMYDSIASELSADSPFRTTVHWWCKELGTNVEAARNWARTDPDMDRPATVAELFSNLVMPKFYRLLWQGLMVRMLDGEIGIGNGTPAIRAGHKRAKEVFDQWAGELDADLEFRTVPIRKLVAVEMGAALAAAEYVHTKRSAAS